jgi:type IV pilus assembly protein PilQ
LTAVAVVCLCWTTAAAQTDATVVEAGSDVVEMDSDVVEAGNEDSGEDSDLPAIEQRMKKRIYVDHNDVSISTVIRQLAEQADVDIIVSPKVVGNVTVTLTDVPLEEALNNILTVHGCTYVVSDNVLRVITSEEMVAKTEPMLTKTFEIGYIDAKQVVEALDKFKSARGSVSYIQGTSHVIVTDSESKIREISTLLNKIDRVTPQVLVEARIYDITSRDKLDLGVQWEAGRNTTHPFGSTAVGVNPTDGPRNPFATSGFSAPTAKTATGTSAFLRVGTLNEHVDVDALLRAEKEITNAKLLANPRIMVLDNETALFDIVTEHPYVERTISEGSITETINFKEVGVKLQVTPHVTRNGMVRLHIMPEFGVFVERVTLTTSDVPVVDTRKVDTIALIEDGQTVVLGGMRKKDVSKEVNKVPLLGDVPILGFLFRFEGEDTAVTELVVFITPKIMYQQPVMSADEQQAYEETNFGGPEQSLTRAEKDMVDYTRQSPVDD